MVTRSDSTSAKISSRKKSAGPSARKRVKSSRSESASSNTKNMSDSSDSENGPRQDSNSNPSPSPSKCKVGGKSGALKRNSKRVAERVVACMQKRQKKMISTDSDNIVSGVITPSSAKLRSNTCKGNEDSNSSQRIVKSPVSGRSRRKLSPMKDSLIEIQGEMPDGSSNEIITDRHAASCNDSLHKDEFADENLCKQERSSDAAKSWKTIEKGLFEKGVEIFGQNRSVYLNMISLVLSILFIILCNVIRHLNFIGFRGFIVTIGICLLKG